MEPLKHVSRVGDGPAAAGAAQPCTPEFRSDPWPGDVLARACSRRSSVSQMAQVVTPPSNGCCVCDACPACDDVCPNLSCEACSKKRLLRVGLPAKRTFTLCEVRRHIEAGDCWLVAKDSVYDVSMYDSHPVSMAPILRKAGGTDCAVDFNFHSASAKKLWSSFRIGRLCRCK